MDHIWNNNVNTRLRAVPEYKLIYQLLCPELPKAKLMLYKRNTCSPVEMVSSYCCTAIMICTHYLLWSSHCAKFLNVTVSIPFVLFQFTLHKGKFCSLCSTYTIILIQINYFYCLENHFPHSVYTSKQQQFNSPCNTAIS